MRWMFWAGTWTNTNVVKNHYIYKDITTLSIYTFSVQLLGSGCSAVDGAHKADASGEQNVINDTVTDTLGTV